VNERALGWLALGVLAGCLAARHWHPRARDRKQRSGLGKASALVTAPPWDGFGADPSFQSTFYVPHNPGYVVIGAGRHG
jgi:hypothetical protein